MQQFYQEMRKWRNERKNIFESNRAAWNQASAYHQKARNHSLYTGFQDPEFSTFKRERDSVVNERLKQMDFSGKTIAHISCNNGRELEPDAASAQKKGLGSIFRTPPFQRPRSLPGLQKKMPGLSGRMPWKSTKPIRVILTLSIFRTDPCNGFLIWRIISVWSPDCWKRAEESWFLKFIPSNTFLKMGSALRNKILTS